MTIYKIKTSVKTVERLKKITRTTKDETSGVIYVDEIDLGWFVGFEGSWERLGLGEEKPDLKVGQAVEIRIKGL